MYWCRWWRRTLSVATLLFGLMGKENGALHVHVILLLYLGDYRRNFLRSFVFSVKRCRVCFCDATNVVMHTSVVSFHTETRLDSKQRKPYCGAQINAFSALCSWMGIAIETPTALLPLRRFDDVKEQKKEEEGNRWFEKHSCRGNEPPPMSLKFLNGEVRAAVYGLIKITLI